MNIRRWIRTLLISLAALLAFSATAQERLPEYRLGSGDRIRISVFQNPDLTVETRVTENGTISYPLVGSVKVGGLTIPAAEQAIGQALKGGNFIKEPQVNISLLQNRGNQVSVLGEVRRPGRYPLETVDIRLSEMIAIGGGIAPTGADTVILTGTRDGKPLRKEVDLVGMFLDNKFDDDIVVAGGDVIYVHRQPVFYIYGEVQKAGAFRIERGMTIRQALAQGGGPNARGTEKGLLVYRRNAAGTMEQISPDMNDLVRPNDVLRIQESLF